MEQVMRNSRVFHSLGIQEAANILKQSRPMATNATREDSGSLYQPEAGEDVEQGVFDKVPWWQPNIYVKYAVDGDNSTFMLNMQYMSKAQSFVLNMQNYSFCCNLLYHVGGHARLGT